MLLEEQELHFSSQNDECSEKKKEIAQGPAPGDLVTSNPTVVFPS